MRVLMRLRGRAPGVLMRLDEVAHAADLGAVRFGTAVGQDALYERLLVGVVVDDEVSVELDLGRVLPEQPRAEAVERRNRDAPSFVCARFAEELIDAVASRCTEVDSGARNIDHILTNTLLPEMSKEMLSIMAGGGDMKEVRVAIDEEGFVFNII